MGEIGEGIRLIKIFRDGRKIVLEIIFEENASDESVECAQSAGAEIIADFPETKFEERFKFSNDEISKENIITSGWIYRRKES